MTARDLIEIWAARLFAEQKQLVSAGSDEPIAPVTGRLLQAVGTLYLYEFRLPPGRSLAVDTPLSIVPPDDMEPTEGVVLSCRQDLAVVQTFDMIGRTVEAATIIPDRGGFLATSATRLTEMLTQPDAYRLGPADRLVPLLEASSGADETGGSTASILTTIWSEDLSIRRQRIASMAMELIRANKRILLICPDHDAADEVAGTVARAMKAGGLIYKTWISRYEMTLAQQASGLAIQELGFEAQMHQFYAKSRADKAALRRKYERFRELTPLLAYKGQKQKDLDEVRLLEWRLLTQLSDLQTKTKEANAILAEYENLPLLRRLSMQAVGKNVESLHQYLELYESQIAGLMKELDIAKARIEELVPEAAVPKDLRPEFEELKDDIIRLGGTKKIRELLAAEEDTNRQAFIQNRRLVITTAARVLSDPLFSRVRFDVLVADNAPLIPAPVLLGSAGLVRERIVLTGDTRDIAAAGLWTSTEMAIRSQR
ncbi:MAG TPA: hypothetical protein VKP13_12285 [Nitrospira sp.]|nr:hypothetical protein [Nitrospira sp.]